MRARNSPFYLLLALLFITTSANQVFAEFRCTAEISYKWVKRPTETPVPHTVPPVALGGHAVAPTTPPTATPLPKSTPEPTVVRLMGLERAGTDEAAARANLQMEIDRQRIRASEACKRDHESYGTCVALKLSSRASVLNSLGFNARTELEKALSDECRQQEGSCVGVDVTEPKCREVAGAKAADDAGAGKAGDPKAGAKGGKDAKKK